MTDVKRIQKKLFSHDGNIRDGAEVFDIL